MTRFWDGQTDGRMNGRTEGRSDCTPRPAIAFGDAGKNSGLTKNKLLINTVKDFFSHTHSLS